MLDSGGRGLTPQGFRGPWPNPGRFVPQSIEAVKLLFRTKEFDQANP
jgi:hypothetical protein